MLIVSVVVNVLRYCACLRFFYAVGSALSFFTVLEIGRPLF
jgi:hypothetical protein